MKMEGSERLSEEELLEYQLTMDDFEYTADGVLIKYNSNIIKKIFHDQKLANELRNTHNFYIKSKNAYCAGVTIQILSLSNYGGKYLKKEEGS